MSILQRLTRERDFINVRREGRAWPDRYIVLLTRPNGMNVSRAGYSVGKRVGNAVVRNRTKRLLRESLRTTRIKTGWDLVIIARKHSARSDFLTFRRSIHFLAKRSGILEHPRDSI